MEAAHKKLVYIDALRGYAITLVVASHAFPMAHELPWTVKRFSNLGFYGVQLFFVVSSVTLARSWNRQANPSVADFINRRLFRIAPAYFLAAIGYLFLLPHASFGPGRVATFLTFTSGWSPAQMPTIHGAWVGVPGGWSIEAEFAFYALFPLVMRLRGWNAAIAALIGSLPIAWLANTLAIRVYGPLYGADAADQFVYYWLPNQAPVFLAGLVLFQAMEALRRHPDGGAHKLLARHAPGIMAVSLALFASLAVIGWPRVPTLNHALIPAHVIAACTFCVVTAVMAVAPPRFVVNRPIVWLGQASFSAYLIHFAIISGLQAWLPAAAFSQVGVSAALAGCALFTVVLLSTMLCAQLTYRLIELPGVALGAQIWRYLNTPGKPA